MTTPTHAESGTAVDLFPFGPLREIDARFCPHCYAEPGIPCATQAHWPEIRHRHPIYLSGVHCAATAALEAGGADIGLILQPGSHLHDAAPAYRWWAADNGCFAETSRREPFDPMAWFTWLAGLPDVAVRRRCLFATAPDVLGDADATWARSEPWLTYIRGIGIPAALVAQNGAEDHAAMWDNDELWDVLFLGGDTAWKLQPRRPRPGPRSPTARQMGPRGTGQLLEAALPFRIMGRRLGRRHVPAFRARHQRRSPGPLAGPARQRTDPVLTP